MDKHFLQTYADLVVRYCLAFKPEHVSAEFIVYNVPVECAELTPYLVEKIIELGYNPLDKNVIEDRISEPVIYISIVGDNLIGQLYSHEMLKPQYFEKAHILLSPFPTDGRAEAAGMSRSEYLSEFEKIFFLKQADPLEAWRVRLNEIRKIKEDITALQIEKIAVTSPSMEFTFNVGKNKVWLGASGRNLPSSEIFTSPDWRTVSGHIYFNVPMNKYGYTIKNIHCTLEDGIITEYSCDNDKDQLDKILGQPNMLKIGEFSLTDKKVSAITKYMANSILDENLGGESGNMHLALGTSYKNAYSLYHEKMTLKELDAIGFNQAGDHIDFMNSEEKEVSAWNSERGKFLLYKNGSFQY